MATNAKQQQTKTEDTQDHEVLSRLSHDGVDYQVGDTVALTAAQAQALGTQVVRPVGAGK